MNKRIILVTIAISALFAVTSLAQMHQQSSGHDMKTEDSTRHSSMSEYPLETCIVSGQKLGSMGDPVVINHEGRQVKLCCQGCVSTFNKDPEKYLQKMDAAIIEAQKASYPLETCVVSGEKLGGMGAPVDVVYNNQLVRFCCSSCVATFEKDPEMYLKKLEEARTKAQEKQRNN